MKISGTTLAAWHAHIKWRMLVLLLASCIAAAGPTAFAAPEEGGHNGLERSVKAAFLYKFIGYIEWPPAAFPGPDSPYVIGVADADTVAAELVQIAHGRTVNRRSVTVRKVSEEDELSGLHMLFIGRNAASRQAQLLEAAQQYSIVTVTETDDALAQGSVINFRVTEGRVRFDVSLPAAEKSDLKLSSRMLSVASSVQRGSRR